MYFFVVLYTFNKQDGSDNTVSGNEIDYFNILNNKLFFKLTWIKLEVQVFF